MALKPIEGTGSVSKDAQRLIKGIMLGATRESVSATPESRLTQVGEGIGRQIPESMRPLASGLVRGAVGTLAPVMRAVSDLPIERTKIYSDIAEKAEQGVGPISEGLMGGRTDFSARVQQSAGEMLPMVISPEAIAASLTPLIWADIKESKKQGSVVVSPETVATLGSLLAFGATSSAVKKLVTMMPQASIPFLNSAYKKVLAATAEGAAMGAMDVNIQAIHSMMSEKGYNPNDIDLARAVASAGLFGARTGLTHSEPHRAVREILSQPDMPITGEWEIVGKQPARGLPERTAKEQVVIDVEPNREKIGYTPAPEGTRPYSEAFAREQRREYTDWKEGWNVADPNAPKAPVVEQPIPRLGAGEPTPEGTRPYSEAFAREQQARANAEQAQRDFARGERKRTERASESLDAGDNVELTNGTKAIVLASERRPSGKLKRVYVSQIGDDGTPQYPGKWIKPSEVNQIGIQPEVSPEVSGVALIGSPAKYQDRIRRAASEQGVEPDSPSSRRMMRQIGTALNEIGKSRNRSALNVFEGNEKAFGNVVGGILKDPEMAGSTKDQIKKAILARIETERLRGMERLGRSPIASVTEAPTPPAPPIEPVYESGMVPRLRTSPARVRVISEPLPSEQSGIVPYQQESISTTSSPGVLRGVTELSLPPELGDIPQELRPYYSKLLGGSGIVPPGGRIVKPYHGLFIPSSPIKTTPDGIVIPSQSDIANLRQSVRDLARKIASESQNPSTALDDLAKEAQKSIDYSNRRPLGQRGGEAGNMLNPFGFVLDAFSWATKMARDIKNGTFDFSAARASIRANAQHLSGMFKYIYRMARDILKAFTTARTPRPGTIDVVRTAESLERPVEITKKMDAVRDIASSIGEGMKMDGIVDALSQPGRLVGRTPQGKKLVEFSKKVWHSAQKKIDANLNKFSGVIKNIPRAMKKELIDKFAEDFDSGGRAHGLINSNPHFAAMANVWRAIADEAISEAQSLGLKTKLPGGGSRPIGRIPNYWPRFFTYEAKQQLVAGRGPIFDAIMDYASRNNLNITPIEIQFMVGDPTRTTQFGPLENSRLLSLPLFLDVNGTRTPVFETDPFVVIPRYINGSWRRMEMVRHSGGQVTGSVTELPVFKDFMSTLPLNSTDIGPKTIDHAIDMLISASGGGGKASGGKVTIDPAETKSLTKSVGHGLHSIFAAGALSGSAVPNAIGSALVPFEAPFKGRAVKIFIDNVMGKQSVRNAIRNIQGLGYISDNSLSRMTHIDSLYNDAGTIMSDMAKLGIEMSGMKALNNFIDKTSAATVSDAMQIYGGKIRRGEITSAEVHDMMSILGLSKSDIEIIKNALATGNRIPNEVMKKAIAHFASSVNGTYADPTQISPSSRKGLMGSILFLTSFAAGRTRRAIDMIEGLERGQRLMNETGDPTVLRAAVKNAAFFAAGSILTSYAIRKTRDYLYNREDKKSVATSMILTMLESAMIPGTILLSEAYFAYTGRGDMFAPSVPAMAGNIVRLGAKGIPAGRIAIGQYEKYFGNETEEPEEQEGGE